MAETARTPVLCAYDRVIERVKEIHKEKHGSTRGAVAWLATHLGVTRQTVDNWGHRVGIPEQYVPKVARLIKFLPYSVRPETVILEMTSLHWKDISEQIPDIVPHVTVHHNRRIKHG